MFSVKAHLKERHFNAALYTGVYTDDTDGVATFLLFTPTGKLVGYQQYRPLSDKKKKNDPKEGRYYTYLTKPNLGAFGYETLKFRKDVLFVQEGVFDACRLHNRGYPALAVCMNDPKPMRNQLRLLRLMGYKLGSFLDGGKPGDLMRKFVDFSVKMPEGRDLGSLTENELDLYLSMAMENMKNGKKD